MHSFMTCEPICMLHILLDKANHDVPLTLHFILLIWDYLWNHAYPDFKLLWILLCILDKKWTICYTFTRIGAFISITLYHNIKPLYVSTDLQDINEIETMRKDQNISETIYGFIIRWYYNVVQFSITGESIHLKKFENKREILIGIVYYVNIDIFVPIFDAISDMIELNTFPKNGGIKLNYQCINYNKLNALIIIIGWIIINNCHQFAYRPFVLNPLVY
eukprot:282299_1